MIEVCSSGRVRASGFARWRRQLLMFFVAIAAAAIAAAGPGASSAHACSAYWNVPVGNACQYYSPSEGHTETQICCSSRETTHSTFDTYSTVLHIWTTAGGGWISSSTMSYNSKVFWNGLDGSDKVGCYNHHTGTMYVNCHHGDGWET